MTEERRTRRILRPAVALAAAIAVAGPAAGCGETRSGGGGRPSGEDPAQAGAGAQVFREAGCGTCHALSAAGSRGGIGPPLDGRNLDRREVARQVRQGGGGMPAYAGRLSEEEIEAVVAYVARSSGR